MRWDSWNKLSGFHGIFETEGQGLSHLANFSLLMETEKDTGHKHTCHPWSFDCCRTERHFSSRDSFFLSPSVGTTRSLYLTRQRKTQNIRAPGINTLNLKTQTRHGGSLFWKQWVQGSLGSFRIQAKQHLFLLAVSRATVVMNGQLDGVSGLFMHWVVWREAESKKSEYSC